MGDQAVKIWAVPGAIVAALLPIVLAGCLSTASTPDEVRSGDGLKETFVVSRPYEDVLRDELHIADACFEKSGPPTGYTGARSTVDAGRRMATITFGYQGPVGWSIWAVIDLEAHGENTEIRTATYSSLLQWHNFGTWVKEWANGGKVCHVGPG